MEMSVRQARALFAAALAAAERGERVTITKNGRAIAELGPLQPPVAPPVSAKKAWDWAELDCIQEELGIPTPDPPLDDHWRKAFDDPAFSREVLGLEDDWQPYRP